MTAGTRVVLLGTGTPNPDPERLGPALAVVVGDHAYLVDFGPGVVHRANEAHRAGIAALDVSRLGIAFLTHLHSDHTAGYPDLVHSPWVLGRPRPLEVYGPPGISRMTEHVLAAWEMDREERGCGLQPIDDAGYGAVAHEIGPGPCYEDERVRVQAFAVDHGRTWLALGYRFDTADRSVVVSGDTAPDERLLAPWEGCDVLVHEVYSARGYATRPPEWQRYHAHMHTSTTELAAIARRVRPKLLVLTHLLLWGVDEETLVAEVKAGYDGEVVCGRDLGVY